MTRRTLRSAASAATLCLLGAGAVAAQAWRGGADLEIRVSARRGGDVAGARVELMYRDSRDPDGPPPVATDSNGRAIVLGLAAGTWQVEVSHPDYMSFVAVVRLDSRDKPQITASFLEASAASSTPIQVKILKARGGPASPPLPGAPRARREEPAPPPPAPPPVTPPAMPRPAAPEPAPAEPPAPETPAPETPAPETPAPEAPAPEAAPPATPAPEAPAVAPEPTAPAEPPAVTVEPPAAPAPAAPAPAPEPAPVEPAPDAPAVESPAPEGPAAEVPSPETPAPEMPAPETPAPEMPAPEMPAPEVPAPAPEPEPAMPEPEPAPEPVAPAVPTPAAPVPAPAPAAPPAPGPAPQWRSQVQRTCPECRAGEWALTLRAPLAGGTCDAVAGDALAAPLAAMARGPQLELAGFAGAAADAVALLPAADAGAVRDALAAAERGGCRVLAAVLPPGGRFVGFQYEVEDADGRRPCLPDQPCPGGGRFAGTPRLERGAGVTVAYGLAAGPAGADALLTVYFRSPNDDWRPNP